MKKSLKTRSRSLDKKVPGGVPYSMREHGFWDYTTPAAGGAERYQLDDYRRLLDDMAGAGMNSLLLVVKWFTTGYRSRLSFLDQMPDNPVIASDNALLRQVISEAHARRILLRLGAVVSIYPVDRMTAAPINSHVELTGGYPLPFRAGYFDPDASGVQSHAVQICEEIIEVFSEADGLMVEIEGADADMPHRIPRYEQWATAKGYPAYANLGHPLGLRLLDIPGWRAYTTQRRVDIMQDIERALRSRKFAGSLCTICETGSTAYTMSHEVDLEMMHRACPAWDAVTYEYEKTAHRYAMMDLCIETPKKIGLTTFYLPRGIMTWGTPPRPTTLRQGWEMDVEDILRFRPDGVWWFGAGTRSRGAHADCTRLTAEGFQDEYDARRALLQAVAPLTCCSTP